MPETIDTTTTIRCPMCERDVEVTADRKFAEHDAAPPCRSLCGWSNQPLVGPGTSMGCDGCYCTLAVDGRETWPTVAEAVAAAHSAGWTGDAHWSLCAECTAARKG